MCSSRFLRSPPRSRGVVGEHWLQLQSLTSWLYLTYNSSFALALYKHCLPQVENCFLDYGAFCSLSPSVQYSIECYQLISDIKL